MDIMRVEPSWRQPFGILLILLLIAGWAALVASAAALIEDAPRWIHIFFYLIAGIVWILPLKPLLSWMETGRWRTPRDEISEGRNGASDGT
jgi:predicted membrane channel-forming protein YqfA (hemolysin III family)